MKCSHCNVEVADGVKFCPECGNRIEEVQPKRCPQCNTEVEDGVKFCPECGNRIEDAQPKKCPQCDTEVEDGIKFSVNCAKPIPDEQQDKGGNTIRVIWDGERKKQLWNNPISVYSNDQICAQFSPKESFENIFPVVSSSFSMQLEWGTGPFSKTNINLELDPTHSYVLFFFFNSAGSFGYELQDENGRLIGEDGNITMLMFFLFLFIPLVGFIYYFIKKAVQPLSAKIGLLVGFVNIVLTILWNLLH